MVEKRLLILILALFLILGTCYALVTPVFEASDELWHYPMVRHLADGNPLPVQTFDPETAGPWKQEASQPPLYYWVAAALTFWIDTSDMEVIRRLNPHVDNGVITPDGNINLVVHDPDVDRHGVILAVRVIRLASVVMGAVTVYMTYQLGKQVAPRRPEISLGAAAAVAFTPMFLFISGAVNNDNLAIMLAAISLVLLVALVQGPPATPRAELGRTLLIGAVIGLALLTKEGTFALLPLAWGVLFIRKWVLKASSASDHALSPRLLLRLLYSSLGSFLILMLPVLLIAGWWYYRNVLLYGDWLGWNAFIAVLGQRPQPASLAQLWDERAGFLMSYWGLFGGVNVPMWNWIYQLLNALLLVAIVGFMAYVGQQALTWRMRPLRPLGSFAGRLLDLVVQYFALLVCLLFSAAVIYGLINWATITWSSQGRLVFTALSSLSVLLVVGLVGWLPPRWAQTIAGGLALFMLVVSAAAPFLWIAPAYDPARYTASNSPDLLPTQADFGEYLRLTGYSVKTSLAGADVVRPGEAIEVKLSWEVLQAMNDDWSVFVHLSDPVLNAPVAQRDMYHGQGLRPTSLLTAGERITTYYQLTVPETTAAPASLDIIVGLYDFESGERLPVSGTSDSLLLTPLTVEAQAGELPNPLSVNFGDAVELLGYELSDRRAMPGDSMMLTLYWRPIPGMNENYTFFAQILDDDTTRWASADIAPAGGTRSAPENDVQTLLMPLTLDADTPANVYPLIVGLYVQDEAGDFRRLQVVEDGRITMADFVELTKVRIVGEFAP